MRKSKLPKASTKTTSAPVVAPKLVRPTISEQDIARRAFEIYLTEGRPEGRQEQHWLRAQSELRRS